MNKPLFYEVTDERGVTIYSGTDVVLWCKSSRDIYQLAKDALNGCIRVAVDGEPVDITNQVWLWGFIEKIAPWMRRHGV